VKEAKRMLKEADSYIGDKHDVQSFYSLSLAIENLIKAIEQLKSKE
jgi:hypothetical protein